jgi:signal transduction histidine kinase
MKSAELKALKEKNRQLEFSLRQKERELSSIQGIGEALSSALNLDRLLRLIIPEISKLMDAERSTLFIVDHERKEIWSKIAQKAEIKEIRQPLGKGISGYVAETGETINIPDAYRDSRFDPTTDKKTGYRTRSILCMPVWEPSATGDPQKITAVIQVLNKKEGIFTPEDEALLGAIASQVSISISNAYLYQRLEKKFREIDLLYELEQLLSVEYALPAMMEKILTNTVEHLKAQWVLASFPGDRQYFFVSVNNRGEMRLEKQNSISLGWMNFVQNPSTGLLIEFCEECKRYFNIDKNFDPRDIPVLAVPIFMSEEERGVLIAVNVHEGEGQDHEDERKMLELVAQKISRAIELFHLRDSLLKQERLSAIGQMMSTIVHDIRAPVNTIYGFVDLMEDKTTTDNERSEYSEIIRDEIKSAMNMITEVLDFARGKTSILPRKSSVKNVLKRFKPRIEEMCQQWKTDLIFDIKSNKLIYVDEDKLNRVFFNVSKNALEAMGEGGKFIFQVSDEGEKVVFRFSDNGPGIPREIQNRLFDSFVTGGKESGTGLGLAIVKKIVDEHGGEIEIESREGEGATFRIKLPVYQKN